MDIRDLLEKIQGHPEFSKFIYVKRMNLFQILHEIVFYGKGGYDFDTVYNMPIWLRKFIYKQMEIHYENEAEALEGSGNSKSITSEPKIPDQVLEKIKKTKKTADFTVKR